MIKTVRFNSELKAILEKHLEQHKIKFSKYVKDLIKKDLKIE